MLRRALLQSGLTAKSLRSRPMAVRFRRWASGGRQKAKDSQPSDQQTPEWMNAPGKFEPDTEMSGKLFKGFVIGITAAGAFMAFKVYQEFYSEDAVTRDLQKVKDIPLYKGNPVVYLDIVKGQEPVGRVIIQLRKDVCPKAAENFRALCTGEHGFGYKNSRFHGVLPGSWIIGGDFTKGNGEGGYSIYGPTYPDENYTLKHIGPGMVGSISVAPHQNSSLFYITLAKAPALDNDRIIFGNVMEGFEVLEKLGEHGNWRGEPTEEFRIAHCGELRAKPAAVE